MSHDEERPRGHLPAVPPEPGGDVELPPLAAKLATGAPDALGFHLRFESGRALLALENSTLVPGVTIHRALFEVPDVTFPVDVTGGAHRFQDKLLTLRAVELDVDASHLLDPASLGAGGLRLLRSRTRQGALELLFDVDGPGAAVTVRARVHIVPAGNAGIAFVVDGLTGFGPLPAARLALSELVLRALSLPGGFPPRAMVRRAEVFRAVFARLLPSYGWKVPLLGDVRVHEAMLQRSTLTLRGWSGDAPDGWKKPRAPKRAHIDDAVALAVFADAIAETRGAEARLTIADRAIDAGEVPAVVAPFIAEILRADERRRAEAAPLLDAAQRRHPTDLALASAALDDAALDDETRIERLRALGDLAEEQAEPWVSAHAFHAAAARARVSSKKAGQALALAKSAFDADPTVGETGRLYAELLSEGGRDDEALKVGRQALERLDEGEDASAFAVVLAPIAARVEGAEAARQLLVRALRQRDRADALAALIEIEADDDALDRASELLARLLVLDETKRDLRKTRDVHVLAARIAERAGDRARARAHLVDADRAVPGDVEVGVARARLEASGGDVARAIDILTPFADVDEPSEAAAYTLVGLLRARGLEQDAARARALVERTAHHGPTRARERALAEVEALAGRPLPLALLVEAEARALEGPARAARLLVAADHFLAADERAHAIASVVDAIAAGASPTAVVEALHAHEPSVVASLFAGAPGESAIAAGERRRLARAFADAGSPLAAARVLDGATDVDDLRARVAFVEETDDHALRVDAWTELRAALPSAERPDATVSLARALLARDEQRATALAAARLFAEAHADGARVDDEWLAASIRAEDPVALADVLVALDVEPSRVPSTSLRVALESAREVLDGKDGLVLALSRALTDRGERVDGVRTDLALYCVLLDERASPRDRAQERIRLGREQGVPALVAEGVGLLVDAGDADLALEWTRDADLGAAEDARVLEARFLAAVVAMRAVDVDDTATRLLQILGDGPRDARLSFHAERARALRLVDGDGRAPYPDPDVDDADLARRRARAITGWLDDDEAAPVLEQAMREALEEGRVDDAEGRFLRAAAHLDGERIAALGEALAAERARANDVDGEIRARARVAARDDVEPAILRVVVDRLARLYEGAGAIGAAVAAFRRRAEQGGDPADVAMAWRSVARLEQDPRAAAQALSALLAIEPNDDVAEQRCIDLLAELDDSAALADALTRRAARLEEGAERTAALVRLGVLVDEKLGDTRRAVRALLRAARSRPFSEVPHRRLLAIGQRENDLRVTVRAHLAAARAIFDGDTRARHAIEGGALLAGMLMRPGLAVPLLERAARDANDPRPALRALVEVQRARSDGPRALVAAERFTAASPVENQAVGLEIQADIVERMLGDVDRAVTLRETALALDPAMRVSGLALFAHHRAAGRLRDAIAVRRRLAESSEANAQRAQTYASLADMAEADLDDRALFIELATLAVGLDKELRSLRTRVVEALLLEGDVRAACEELGVLADADDTPRDERIALARRRAQLEAHELDDPTAARATLTRALTQVGDADLLIAPLVDAMARLDLPLEAAQLLESVLTRHEDGLGVLGSRRDVLERAASLREDGEDPRGAMDLLDEAAALGKLSRVSELRRARLAEGLDRPGDAMVSLQTLLGERAGDVDDTVALAGRLATAAERAGRFDIAIAAWSARVEVVRGDVEAERRLEELARTHGVPDAARRAAEALLLSEDGDDSTRRARLVFVAEDALNRTQEPARALGALAAARAIEDDDVLLALSLRAARESDDGAAELALLDERSSRQAFDDAEVLRHVELLADHAPARGLATVAALVDEGRASDALWLHFDRAVRAAPAAAVDLLLARAANADDSVAARLRAALPELETLDDDRVRALSERLPVDIELARESALRARSQGRVSDAVDRLIAVAAARGDDDEDARAVLDDAAREVVGQGADLLVPRVARLARAIVRDDALRTEALRVLRDSEAWPATATLLEASLDVLSGADARRVRFELALVLRAELSDPRRAAAILEPLLDEDESDREVWGELLESLDEADDDVELARLLGRRLTTATGFERRELTKRRAAILLRQGRAEEALDDIVRAREGARDDDALRALHFTVAEAASPAALAALSVEELRATSAPADAARVLAAPKGAVSHEALSRAVVVALDADVEMADALVARLLDEEAEPAALAFGAAVEGSTSSAARRALVDALLRAVPSASRGAVIAHFVDSTHEEIILPLALADVGEHATARGPRAALARLRAIAPRVTERASLVDREARLMARAGEGRAARQAVVGRGVALDEAALRGTLLTQARAHVERVARRGAGLRASVRVADADAARAAWSVLSSSERASAHVGVRSLRTTPARLPVRLALVVDVDADARLAELRALGAVARDSGDDAREAVLLDLLIADGAATAVDVDRRADVAATRREPSLPEHLARAALSGAPERRVERRRALVLHAIQRGAPPPEIAEAIDALAHADDDDGALLEECLELARAARLDDMLDELLGSRVARAKDDAERKALVLRRVDHRRRVGRDARGAFDLLMAEGERDLAYALAASEGLVEEQLAVLDDPVAEAAIAWLVGRRDEARSALARAPAEPAAHVLAAEIARGERDVDAERGALQALVDAGLADAEHATRLADLWSASDADRAAHLLFAAPLVTARRATRAQACEVAATLVEAGLPVAAHMGALTGLLDHATDGAVLARAIGRRAADEGVDATDLLAQTVVEAGDDARDALYLEHVLRHRTPAEAGARIAELGARPAVLSLARVAPIALRDALSAIASERAPFVISLLRSLGGDVPLPAPLAWLLVDVLEAELRLEEAAELLASIVDDTQEATEHRRLRGIALEVRRGNLREAALALQNFVDGPLDPHVRSVALGLVGRIGTGAIPVALRLATVGDGLSSEDGSEAALALALDLAEDAPAAVVEATAAFVLDRRRGDGRALSLLARRASPPVRRALAPTLALRGEGRFDISTNDESSTARALRLRTRAIALPDAPPSSSSALVRARSSGSDERRSAWAVLADEAARRGEPGSAARFLARAGLTLEGAPIEIRLVADPALRDPSARVAAIAEALAVVDARVPRADLLVELARLDENGYAGARHRALLSGDEDLPLLDLALAGVRPALFARVAALPRHARSGERSALAAALLVVGAAPIAHAVHPGIAREARPAPTHRHDDPVARVSAALLEIAREGTSSEREAEILELAQRAGRDDVAAASHARAAALAKDPVTRARHHLDRARLCLGALAAPRVALAAARAVLETEDDRARDLHVEAAGVLFASALAVGSHADGERALAVLEGQAASTAARARVIERRIELNLKTRSAQAARAVVDAALEDARLDDAARVDLLVARARVLAADGDAAGAQASLVEAAERAPTNDRRETLARRVLDDQTGAAPADAVAARAWLLLVGADAAASERALAHARASDDALLLARVLETCASVRETLEEKRPLVLERARVIRDALRDRDAAINALEEQALADANDHASRVQLADWYLAEKRLLDAALALESATTIEGAPDDVVCEAARVAAALLGSLGDLERAAPLAERALTLGARDHGTLQVLAATYREHARYDALDDVLAIQLELVEEPRARAAIWIERALLRRDLQVDAASARKAVHQALELVPDERTALDLMREDAAQSDSFGALRAALSRAAELTDDDAHRVTWLMEISSLDEERFKDLRAASATIERALDVVGQDPTLLVRKAHLLAKQGKLDGLPRVLADAERAGATDFPGPLQIVRGDALLIEGDRAGAARAFEAATRDKESRDKAWDRLVDMAEAASDDTTLALRLSFARAATEDPTRRAGLSRREARLRGRMGDEERATAAFEAVLEDAPGDSEAMRALVEVYVRRRKADKLEPVMERWARAGGDAAERARRLAELGVFLLDQVGAEARARAAFDSALTEDPREPTALVRLAGISSSANQHARALELLDRIEPASWPGGFVDLLHRRAIAARALGAEDASARFRAVLEVAPRFVPALEGVVELADQANDRLTLRGALVALTEAIDERADPVRLAKALTELARVHVDEGSPEDALRAAERAFELRPTALATLHVLADARALSGQFAGAAEIYRRIEALSTVEERPLVMEQRAIMHERAGELAKAIEVLEEMQALGADERLAARVTALKKLVAGTSLVDQTVKIPIALAAPTQARGEPFAEMPVTAATNDATRESALSMKDFSAREDMTSPGFNALTRQVEGLIDDGRHADAMALLREAFSTGSADAEHAQLGIRAARAAKEPRELAFFVEERLKGASDQEEVKSLALEAGRALRDVASEPERAADLLYLAHQAAPDDIDVRLELTELYARIPRLLGHAQTGVLQLLRRSPGNARACRIAAVVAERQNIAEKRAAMGAIAEVLSSSAAPLEVAESPPLPRTSARRSLDEATLKARLAPEGFGGEIDVVLSSIEQPLEGMFAVDANALVSARRLSDVSPASLPLFERVDRVLPGRAMKLLVGPNPRTVVHAGTTLHLILPESALVHGDAIALATIARAVFVVRTGGVLASLDDTSAMSVAVELARGALTDTPVTDRHRDRLSKLKAAIPPARLADLRRRAAALDGIDVPRFIDMHRRAADRFALLLSGSLVAALVAGPVPELATSDAQTGAQMLRGSTRGLDLVSFAARDNAWLLRRDLGLVVG